MIASMQIVDPGVRIWAVADPDMGSARRRLVMVEPARAEARMYPSADAMLEDPADYDGIVIGTRCHLHTRMAIKVAALLGETGRHKPGGVRRVAGDVPGQGGSGRRLFPLAPHAPLLEGARGREVGHTWDHQPDPGRKQRALRWGVLRPVVQELRPDWRPLAAESHPRFRLHQPARR